MKKLLTVLLAIMMCLCLVNLNSNNTKAEEVETKETEKLDEEEVLEEIKYEEAAPAEEEVKEEAVAEGVVAEAAEKNPSNDVWHIRTLTDLKEFFNQNEVITDAVLEKDIIITNDSGYTTYSLNVNGNKNLDLNGHDLIIDNTMLLESHKNYECDVRIINSNKNKTSTIRPKFGSKALALIATRLNENTEPFTLEIANVKKPKEDLFENDNKFGDIVFDGMNKSNLVGLLLGLENGNVSGANSALVVNVLFKNFNPSDGYGIAVANINSDLLMTLCEITNSKIGLASGIPEYYINSNLIGRTRLNGNLIHYCGTGIANGLNEELPLIGKIIAAPIQIRYSQIEYNIVGLDLITPEDVLLSDELNKAGLVSIFYGTEIYKNLKRNIYVENIINANESGPVIYVDGSLDKNDVNRVDDRNLTVRIYVDEVKEGLEAGSPLVQLDSESDAYCVELENKNYLFSIMHNNGVGYVVNMPNNVGKIYANTPAVSKGSIATISGNIGDFDPSEGNMYLLGPDMNEIKNVKFVFSKKRIENAPSTSFSAKFIPETSGNYRICYYVEIDGNYYSIISNPIYISVGDPSTPTKDESCEKVIGPTWHWNNTKGVCEEVGVVGTYTR